MINREELIIARNILGNEIRYNMKTDLHTEPYSRLCIIAGELDVLIKILKEKQDDRNKQ